MKKLTKKAMAIVLSVMMLVVFMPTSTFAADATSGDQQSDQQNQAEPTTPPVAEKNLKDNGDGTYDISLSVTGKSESSSESSKADVVVVMDVSGSMDDKDTSSYEENKTGRYGLVDGEYVNLYSKNWWGWGYSEITDDSTTGKVYYPDGESYSQYKGDRYSQATRLAVAKKSIGDLAKQLLSNNDASNPDKVTMSLVTFSNGAKIKVDKRTTLTDFQGGLNGLSADGGTNWEAALQTAGTIKARDGAAKYVIFVSDGNPTYYNGGGTGREQGDNVATCYGYAKDDAKALVTDGWEFYGVGVFGNVDRMQGLVDYAYYGDSEGTATDKYFSASDQTQLMAAFSNIINSITQNFAYSSVVINDGLTGMVSCGIKEGETGGFTYTRSGGAYGDGQTWSDAPPATLTTDKQVVWDLGSTTLEDGVKYTVSFTVWPSQDAYDLVADLKNGVIKYDEDLTEAQKEQIVPMTDDNGLRNNYGLKTNTVASVEYTQIETKTTATEPEGYVSGQPAADGYTYTYDKETRIYTGTKSTKGSAPISNPDPIPLTATAINVYKVWDGGEGTGDVQLKLMKDGKYAGKIVTLNQDNKDNNEDNRWITQVHVAPGLIVDGEILEAGHDYTLVEVDGGYKYEFTSTTCHPMLINSATEIKNADGSACELKGTNTKKSNLEITKTLAGNNNTADNTLFTYKVTVTEKNRDDVWFSIGDGQNVINVDNRVTGATAEETDGVKTGYYSAASGSEITVKIKAGENIFFTNLAKGSTYSVEEVDIPGEYQLQKVVVNQGTEQTNAKAEGTISENKKTYTVAYTNKLLTPTNVTLQATKTVQGKNAPGAFTFSMELASGDRTGVVMPSNTTATTPANMQKGQSETVNFNSIKFTKPGTYTFKVKETNQTVPAGWSYDKTEKTITVVVSANDGALSATVEGNNPEIVNSYSVNAATLSSIPVKKELTGEGAQSFDIRNAFTFTLAAEGNAPLPQTTVIKNPDANGGTAEFGPITYTAAGTYNYTVTESGSVDGIENDPVSSKSVTVEVTDNNEGQLVANITQGANLTFTNKVIEPVEVVLHATKKVEGRDAAEAFTFSIRQTNTNAEGADGVVMPETVTATTPANMQKGQSEKVNFNSIKFTKPGTYTFKVKETNETVPAGWSYDKTERTITVVVSKTNGVLSATVQNDNPTFTNKYSASPVNNFSIPVTKQLEGTGVPDITGKYTFTLTGKNGAPMPADTQKTNPSSSGGNIEFGYITYNSVGEYEYTVTETGTVAHITNDSNATKNITVVVEDNGKGQLVASFKEGDGVTFTNRYAPEPTTAKISVEKILKGTGAPDITGKYTFTLAAKDNAPMPNNNTELNNPASDGGTVTFGDITYTKAGTYRYTVTESGDVPGITNDSNATKEVVVVVTDNKGQLEAVVNSGNTLTFTNTYAPKATSATLEVEKVLKNMELQKNQFMFQLLDSQGESIQEKQNAADGTVKFDTIDYTVPGEYNYTIKEVIPEDAKKAKGVTYDDHEVKVKVTVADTNGVLGATVEYTGNTTFTNTYNASGKSGIVGIKTLKGKTLKDEQFRFKLTGKDGAPMPDDDTATNDANGYVNFGEINFTLADLGIVDEDNADKDGADVATEGESTEQGGTPEEGGSSEPAAAVATSTDEGANDEPSDENKNEDAAVPRTKTFTYTVTEVAGNEPGITYNTTPQEFTITVTDDGQGGLTVTTNPPTDKPNAPLFTIKNTYTPAKANIGVTKNFVDGRTDLGLSAWDECADAEFEFELKAVGDAPLNPVDSGSAATTVKVTKASTSASFGMYEFDSPGKYEYTITEKNSGIKDVVYDATSHKVTVEVKEDSTTHQLSAEVKYDNNEESLVVTNTLKPAENAKLNVVKHVVNTNGQPLSVDGVFHVALFSDKNLTHRVSAVNELVFDGSKPTAEAEFKVTAGKKYYVAETDADGKPLSGAQELDDQIFYICFGDPADYDNVTDYPQSAAAEIPESGSADDVEFSNIFDGSKFMILGSITIDKEVKIGKETKAVDGSFYVTAEYSQGNSDTVEKKTVEIKVKDGKTEQPVTISNLPTDTDIVLKETDKNGDALKKSVYNPRFTYEDESGETLKVTLTEDASDIDVNLVNSEKLIDVAFDLKWDDYNNRDNTRDEYAVTLFANGVEVEDSTMTFGYDVTEGKWTDLRQYDDDGNEIVYSVKQTVVPENYSSNTDGTEFGLAPDEDGIVHLIDVYRAVTITKKVTDSTGKAIKYNGDFYVTMFADPEGKEIAMDPVKISLDNEKSKTVIIPVPANTLYYLAETDADGNKVDSSFEFIPTFSSTIAEVTDDAVSIVLTNEAKAGTPADDPDNDTDAKTGDSANLMLMLLALLTSMLIGAVVLIRGRRREN